MTVTRVEIGQLWRRKTGAVVVVTAERMVSGHREVWLTPAPGHNGRPSWKWELAVMWDMDPVEQEEQVDNHGSIVQDSQS